jgi:uncharacterized protein (TIGR02996 family)
MTSDESFLRAILAAPEDLALRGVYGDWLEENGDRRAEYVRVEAKCRQARGKTAEKLQARLDELAASLDPAWVAFLTTLGQPFEPYNFECEPSELPFQQEIGRRGRLVTFESHFRKESSWDAGLMHDLQTICAPSWGECYYGASSGRIYPFLCELKARHRPLFASDVLAALKARDFQSEHIATLEAASIPYPGYHPGTRNDESHTDFAGQYIFHCEQHRHRDTATPTDALAGTHGVLKGHVAGGQLWYVLLHAGGWPSNYVILLAVGASPHGRRLVGVVTHQVCHNLCD